MKLLSPRKIRQLAQASVAQGWHGLQLQRLVSAPHCLLRAGFHTQVTLGSPLRDVVQRRLHFCCICVAIWLLLQSCPLFCSWPLAHSRYVSNYLLGGHAINLRWRKGNFEGSIAHTKKRSSKRWVEGDSAEVKDSSRPAVKRGWIKPVDDCQMPVSERSSISSGWASQG